MRFLEQHTVANVLREVGAEKIDGHGFEAQVDSTVGDVLNMMNRKNVTLLPIYEDGPEGKLYHGVVDVFDLIGYVVVQSEPSLEAETLSPEFLNHSLRSVLDTGSKPKSKLQLRATTIVKPSDSLHTAVALLSGSSTRHRVLVSEVGSLEFAQEKEGSPVHLLTPDAVLRYLYLHLDLLNKEITERPVRNGLMNRVITARPDDDFVKIHHCKPFTVNMNASALLAFKCMWAHQVRAIGIVNDSHSLVEIFSSTDLRKLSKERLSELQSPAIAFVRHGDCRRPSEPLTCLPTTTFAHIMARLIRTKCHRLFVVDDANRPIGVVSVSDVLSSFLD